MAFADIMNDSITDFGTWMARVGSPPARVRDARNPRGA